MNLKKLSLLVILSMILQSASTQSEWFPIGAEWYYSRQESSLNKNFFLMSVEGDTTIADRAARIIRSPIYSNSDGLIFVSTEGQDSVFVFSEALEDWILLYDFSAQVGDTIHTFLTPWDTSLLEVVIDSISSIEISGKSFDVQYFSTNPRVDWSNQNIRFLGNEQFLLPQNLLVIPQGPLRCYSPSQEKIYSLVPFACDLIPTKNINASNKQIKIYPNPANDFLFITGLDIGLISPTVNIYNSNGQLAQSSQLFENRLPIEDLPIGLYFLSINSNQKLIFSQIFSKN
jgi:hypothetical protein